MITKERLEQLIEQGATIYEAKYNDVVPVSLTNEINSISWRYGVIAFKPMRKHKWLNHKYFKNLFETEEEAREHLEFGNITRTERLPYFPKYENIDYEGGYFIRKFHIKDNYDGFGKLMVIKDFVILVQCSSLGVLHEEYFNKPATRENYNEARRLCVKLFKGEE